MRKKSEHVVGTKNEHRKDRRQREASAPSNKRTRERRTGYQPLRLTLSLQCYIAVYRNLNLTTTTSVLSPYRDYGVIRGEVPAGSPFHYSIYCSVQQPQSDCNSKCFVPISGRQCYKGVKCQQVHPFTTVYIAVYSSLSLTIVIPSVLSPYRDCSVTRG